MDEEAEAKAEGPPKLPRTLQERDHGKRVFVVLVQASLETVKTKTVRAKAGRCAAGAHRVTLRPRGTRC